VYNGGDTLKAWGEVFGLACCSDIFCQFLKIVIILYLPTRAMQPQLKRIRKVLADVSLFYVNRQLAADGGQFEGGRNVDEVEELRVVQHMSAACRASRSNELKGLPAAWLLRQIDDIDASKCREGRLEYPGAFTFLLVALALSVLILNEGIGDFVLDTVIAGNSHP
jgi:hypothetical protein